MTKIEAAAVALFNDFIRNKTDWDAACSKTAGPNDRVVRNNNYVCWWYKHYPIARYDYDSKYLSLNWPTLTSKPYQSRVFELTKALAQEYDVVYGGVEILHVYPEKTGGLTVLTKSNLSVEPFAGNNILCKLEAKNGAKD